MNNETKSAQQQAAETLLRHVDWLSPTEGYCPCPGQSLHAGPAGKRDCRLYLESVPTIHCFHASCKGMVEEKNRELRRLFLNRAGVEAGDKPRHSPEQKSLLKARQAKERQRQRAAQARPAILQTWRWPYEQLLQQSPVKLPGDPAEHWRLLLERFEPLDVVWIGNIYDSGDLKYASNFRCAELWLRESAALAQHICPATFKNNVCARTNDNVVAQRFLVVESDVLGKDEVGAVFRWLKEKVQLPLVAIVDTAGKSLHGWFKFPPTGVLEELKLVLPELGCDPNLFRPSQPVRLPGALRDGKYQHLVYLAKKEVAQ